jgi:hypothetical protein
MDLAREKGIVGSWNFPSMLIDLLSSRPTVFAEAMDAFPDLRSLAIRVVRTEFDSFLSKASNRVAMELDSPAVIIVICQSQMAPEAADKVVEAKLPLALLQSACVLLSIWRDENAAKQIENVAELMPKAKNDDAALAVEELVQMLLRDDKLENIDEAEDADMVLGLASAKIAGSGKSAVPVESVSCLSVGEFVHFAGIYLTQREMFCPAVLSGSCSREPGVISLRAVPR